MLRLRDCSRRRIRVLVTPVSLFQPVTSPTQLPPAGHSAETYSFDIKQNIQKPFDSFELAKDVSAFANANGGVILVGAAEDRKRGTISRYLPLDEKGAKEIRDAYSTAVRDHCSPAPVINPVVLPKDGGHVVAVNVWPFPGQAVGVRQKSVPMRMRSRFGQA